MSVLLTVPHANCPLGWDGKGHPCDTLAKRAADLVFKYGESALVEPPLIPSGTPRTICDLNRIQCRSHPWRGEIRRRIKSGYVAFVLDIHSYPSHTKKWSGFELFVLDDAPWPMPYVMNFVRYIRAAGIRIGVGSGGRNDIQDEARELGVKSMLVEFNEGLGDTDRLDFVASRVAEWFSAEHTVSHPYKESIAGPMVKGGMARQPVLTPSTCLHGTPEEIQHVLQSGVLYGCINEGTPDASDVVIDLRDDDGEFEMEDHPHPKVSGAIMPIEFALWWWWWSPWAWWWWTPRYRRYGPRRWRGRQGGERGRGRISVKMAGEGYDEIHGEVRIGLRERQDASAGTIGCHEIGDTKYRFSLGMIEIKTSDEGIPLHVTSVTVGCEDELSPSTKGEESIAFAGKSWDGEVSYSELISTSIAANWFDVGRPWNDALDQEKYPQVLDTTTSADAPDLFLLLKLWSGNPPAAIAKLTSSVTAEQSFASNAQISIRRAGRLPDVVYFIVVSFDDSDPGTKEQGRLKGTLGYFVRQGGESLGRLIEKSGATTIHEAIGSEDFDEMADALMAVAARQFAPVNRSNVITLELRNTPQALVKPARAQAGLISRALFEGKDRVDLGRPWDAASDQEQYSEVIKAASTDNPTHFFRLLKKWSETSRAAVMMTSSSGVQVLFASNVQIRISDMAGSPRISIYYDDADPGTPVQESRDTLLGFYVAEQGGERLADLIEENDGEAVRAVVKSKEFGALIDILISLDVSEFIHFFPGGGYALELRRSQGIPKPVRKHPRTRPTEKDRFHVDRKWDPEEDDVRYSEVVATASTLNPSDLFNLLREWSGMSEGEGVVRILPDERVAKSWELTLMRGTGREIRYDIEISLKGGGYGFQERKIYSIFTRRLGRIRSLDKVIKRYGERQWSRDGEMVVTAGTGDGEKALDLLDALSSVDDDRYNNWIPKDDTWTLELRRATQTLVKPARTGVRIIIPRILPKKKGVDWIDVDVGPGLINAVTIAVKEANRSQNPWYREGYHEKYALTLTNRNGIIPYLRQQGLRLNMEMGQTYYFEANQVPAKHPFHLTKNDTGGPKEPKEDSLSEAVHKGGTKIMAYTPRRVGGFYYQCTNHEKMGGPAYAYSTSSTSSPILVDGESGLRLVRNKETRRYDVVDEDGYTPSDFATLTAALSFLSLHIRSIFNVGEDIAPRNQGLTVAHIARAGEDVTDAFTPAVLMRGDGTLYCEHIHAFGELRAWLVRGKPVESSQLCPSC